MSPRFLKFMPFILEWETEYNKDGSVRTEHDPDDPGGTTKYGIDQRSHSGINIESLTKEQAMEIYWQEWKEDGCEAMPSPYAEVFFNCAVNMGLGRARQFDKKIPGASTDAFLNQQEAYYNDLATDDHTGKPTRFYKYLKGWLNRTNALRKWVAANS